MKVKKAFNLAIGILFGLIVLGYALFEARFLINGATLSVESPVQGETINASFTKVTGIATRASFITLNGNQIFTDEAGFFEEIVPLLPGYNTITIASTDRFENNIERKIEVIRTHNDLLN